MLSIPFAGPLLAGKGLKILIVIVVLAAIGGTIYAGYAYVTNLQKENAQLASDNAKLTLSTKLLETERDFMRDQSIRAEARLSNLHEELAAARQEAKRSQIIFEDHDFNRLLQAKPGLLEPRMQRATDELLGRLEAASTD